MSTESPLAAEIARSVAAALAEDIGTGDISARLVPDDAPAVATVVTRDAGVFCGRPWAEAVCGNLDPDISLAWQVTDGARIAANQHLLKLNGRARSLLSAERNLLNFIQLLSGTATQAARYVDAVSGTNAIILDTRKTIPGLRLAQKYAVRCGGGQNHRIGLFDAFLIKENHIAAAGSIGAAVAGARELNPKLPVEIEVEDSEQLVTAIEAGADIIMLDNFSVQQMIAAVAVTDRRAKLEASGGITLDTVRAFAETGVDFISVGEITKQVLPLDLSMRFAD